MNYILISANKLYIKLIKFKLVCRYFKIDCPQLL